MFYYERVFECCHFHFFFFDLVLQELDSHFTASLSPTSRDPLPLSARLCPELADDHHKQSSPPSSTWSSPGTSPRHSGTHHGYLLPSQERKLIKILTQVTNCINIIDGEDEDDEMMVVLRMAMNRRMTMMLKMVMITMMMMMLRMALAQNPISTKSHIWVFVRQYGIMFVIIVIIIIIIIIYRKVKVSTLKHV